MFASLISFCIIAIYKLDIYRQDVCSAGQTQRARPIRGPERRFLSVLNHRSFTCGGELRLRGANPQENEWPG